MQGRPLPRIASGLRGLRGFVGAAHGREQGMFGKSIAGMARSYGLHT